MTIRRATEGDEPVLRELWQEFERLFPEPEGLAETWEEEWADVRKDLADGAVHLAEDDEGVVGMSRLTAPDTRGRSHVNLVIVRERARRQGVAKALLRAGVADVKEKGARLVSLDVLTSNTHAHAVWRRLGFDDHALFMHTPLDRLEGRLEDTTAGETRAATYAQTDDRPSVDRALAQFVPRLEAPEVREASNGWIRIVDPLNDVDREVQARLARELSERLGAVVVALALEHGAVVRFRLYERGRMVDEYLSVPGYYGELPKADELALAANPTLVSRLTGADREEIRRLARTAETPADLPPAAELYEALAGAMGLEP
jgi:ribosomal protein S18 acetylase RimI-like enzyme